ncbi:MAG: pilus assembly protein PilC [Gammaproteobacteria bacterium]|nr:pilus assembly protein PilC [Gammaproteobacteria bacterium]
MPRHAQSRFRKTLLALAAGAALAPLSTSALDLAESPPGSVEPYVQPNVIISVDDSGSMDWQITNTSSGDATITAPKADGSWDPRAKRINILKHSLKQVFTDTNLLPDNKIRLGWQAMWNNGNAPGVGTTTEQQCTGSGKSRKCVDVVVSTGATTVDSATKGVNSMSRLQGSVTEAGHRKNFLDFVTSLKAQNGTPSHLMFSQADAYMRRPLDTNSAWASNPGTTGAPFLGCRRTYHIFMSDGRWNGTASGGSQDNALKLTLPDGMVYGGDTATEQKKTALYRDSYANTLADWAFYSWATPLQASGLTGAMQPAADYRKAPATENFGNDLTGNPAILDRYWNPRYNPATWPHMVSYTIGFSTDATTWPGDPSIFGPNQQVPFGYDMSFLDLVTGNKKWPQMDAESKRALDLWHAALNGRGRFYAVMKGEDLEKAFREIVGQINTATDPDLSASATSGSNVSRSEVGKYTAAYEPLKAWKGSVTADRVKPDGTTIPDPGWGGKSTADKLDALTGVTDRLILSWSDKWDSTKFKGGVPFKWATDETNLSAVQKAWLQKNASGTDEGGTKGQQRLDYIRGDRTLEGSETSGYTITKPYRERKSRQGDIINSDVWYAGAPAGDSLLKGYATFVRDNITRPGMLYVGGNDGMLHGFAAADGQEKIAYVPRGAIPSLTLLTDPLYNDKHKYIVDGSPMTGDVDMNGGIQDPKDPSYTAYKPDWRTLLIGTLGLGGRGYFVLDVTNPTTVTPTGGPPAFAEANAQQLVKFDRTRGTTEPAPDCTVLTGAENAACLQAVDEDKDIGYITARPVRDDNDTMRSTQITRMNNNRWAVILGNGYNSANQRPVLLVQYLDGAKELLRIPVTSEAAGVGNAKDNGLAAPRLVDLNGDNRTDVVYAGDNLGNLWKFDLTSATTSNWKVAFGGSPLFTAQGPAALGSTTRTKIQPISAPPTVRANDRTMQVGSGATAKTVRVGGMMVAFGTGRSVSKTDPESVDVQTLYSVLDNTRYKEVSTTLGKRLEVHPGGGTCPGTNCVPAPATLGTGVGAAKLAKQEFMEVSDGDLAAIKPVDELKVDTWANFNGWYLDLPSIGERLLKPMEFYDASNILTVWSQVPAKGSKVDATVESCESTSVDTERQYRTFVNIMDGKSATVQIADANKDGKYNMATGDGILVGSGSTAKYLSITRAKVTKGPHSIVKKSKFENVDIDAKNNKETLASMPEESLRPSWRQIQ